jgi:ABC-2 type transport system permease protein
MAVRNSLRTYLSALWLGWQMDSNWTSPLLFVLYSFVKPLASSLMLVVMYFFVTGGRTRHDLFAFMYTGNAFYMFVMGSLLGLSMVLHIEREHYQTLKYVYLATSNLHLYLFGRASSQVISTAFAVLITLLFGKYVFHIPLFLSTIDFPLLALCLIIGLVGIASFGLILAGMSMLTAMHNFYFAEAFSFIFYLLSGVLFPLSTLPPMLQKIAFLMPFTYWMEATRRALLPHIPPDPLMMSFSTPLLVAIFAAISLLLTVVSLVLFHHLEHLTRKKGTIDMTTAY